MKPRPTMTRDAAETLAIQALAYLAEDRERLGRFLAESGLAPATIRRAAAAPGFLAGVLDYLAGSERLIAAFAAQTGCDPADVERARHALSGAGGGDRP
jgi:hypothetical protein